MSWSYGGDPSFSMVDRVRFLIGDTDPNSPRVQDEEIEFVLTIQPNAWLAGAILAEALAAKASAEVNNSLGDLSEDASERQEKYERLAAMLRGANGDTGVVAVGGSSGSVFPADFAVPWAGGLDIPRAFDFADERRAEGRGQQTHAPGTEWEWGPRGPRYPWQ